MPLIATKKSIPSVYFCGSRPLYKHSRKSHILPCIFLLSYYVRKTPAPLWLHSFFLSVAENRGAAAVNLLRPWFCMLFVCCLCVVSSEQDPQRVLGALFLGGRNSPVFYSSECCSVLLFDFCPPFCPVFIKMLVYAYL